MPEVTLKAPEISCAHCLQSIKSAVEALPGVRFVSGDAETKTVVVEHDPAQSSIATIESAMEAEGYPVEN
jgi:copper chaperone CopZ